MPSRKRSPINYDLQYADGIFRPKDVVSAERQTLDSDPPAPPTSSPAADPASNVRTDERPNERTSVSTVVRHSFDIRTDQLQALSEIQAQEFAATGRKPKMGELAQAALDLYIADKRRRTSERTKK